MSVVNGLDASLRILDAAAGLLAGGKNTPVNRGGKTIAAAFTAADRADRFLKAGSSLSSVTNQTNILSRAFVDESVMDEPILPNVMKTVHEYYAAQVVAALHLTNMVDSQRTVSNVMAIVQAGHASRPTGLIGEVASRHLAQESFLTQYLGQAATESFDPADPLVLLTKHEVSEMDARAAAASKTIGERDKTIADMKNRHGEIQAVKSVATSEHRMGPMGELYEVKLTNPNGDGKSSISVPVFIQMQPSIVPVDIAPRFIDMNVAPSLWQRWTQMRAGEINFWKDFIRQRDLMARYKPIIKDPRAAAAFSDFLKTVSKKDAYAMADATGPRSAQQSANLANSVVVFNQETVMQAKIDSGIDLHNANDRARYFRDTYTMMVIIIDALHQRVTIYMNGIDGEIDASYSDFRPKDSKFEPKDFMQALQAISANNIGRLR